jgi:preprotein translocase subunit SecG
MDHLTSLVAGIHLFVAFILVVVILIQDAKDGGLGAIGGGGGGGTLFGATGAANFLVKVTNSLALVFMITCFGLAYMLAHKNNRSVIDTVPSTTAAPKTGEAPIQNPASPQTPAAPPATSKAPPAPGQ